MCIRDRVIISRTHPGLVKRLFELEVPEIYDGTVEIRSIAREAGSRTKLAVWSADPNVEMCIRDRVSPVRWLTDRRMGRATSGMWCRPPQATAM